MGAHHNITTSKWGHAMSSNAGIPLTRSKGHEPRFTTIARNAVKHRIGKFCVGLENELHIY